MTNPEPELPDQLNNALAHVDQHLSPAAAQHCTYLLISTFLPNLLTELLDQLPEQQCATVEHAISVMRDYRRTTDPSLPDTLTSLQQAAAAVDRAGHRDVATVLGGAMALLTAAKTMRLQRTIVGIPTTHLTTWLPTLFAAAQRVASDNACRSISDQLTAALTPHVLPQTVLDTPITHHRAPASVQHHLATGAHTVGSLLTLILRQLWDTNDSATGDKIDAALGYPGWRTDLYRALFEHHLVTDQDLADHTAQVVVDEAIDALYRPPVRSAP